MFGSLNQQNYTILTSHQENSLEATRRIMVKLHRLKRSVSIETQATFLILGNITVEVSSTKTRTSIYHQQTLAKWTKWRFNQQQ